MEWKSVLKMSLGIALPVIFAIIKAKNPDIPIDENGFISLITWIIGSAIGGYQTKNLILSRKN